MAHINKWLIKRGVGFSVIILSFILLYQNCSPVQFSTNSNSSNQPFSTTNPPVTPACVASINIAPQLSFVPSSFDAGQQFTVLIANENLYGSISINFGDGTPVDVINLSSSAPITHTYAAQGSYSITVTATDSACGTSLNGTHGVAVSPCVPAAVTVQTSLTPQVPVPPPVGSFTTQADITNSSNFTSSSWLLNGAAEPAGSDVTLNLTAGTYILQAEATDTCGGQRPGTPISICVASSGNPVVSVNPISFTAEVPNTFSVANAGSYSSLTISFGDGTSGVIPVSGVGAGTISHTYQNSGSYSYVVTAKDSCGASRTTTVPISVSPVVCTSTQPDGCSNNEYCTGRTSCNPQGSCNTSCNLCGYTGLPVDPATSCNGTQQCVTGGTSCNPTNTCTNVCGQCGYTGTAVTPVTTCSNGQVCTTGGTTCNPTQTCVAIQGQCGVPLPTPTPAPTPSNVPTGGLCGSNNGKAFRNPPSGGFAMCASWTSSQPTVMAGGYGLGPSNWVCPGTNGGPSAYCSAYYTQDGSQGNCTYPNTSSCYHASFFQGSTDCPTTGGGWLNPNYSYLISSGSGNTSMGDSGSCCVYEETQNSGKTIASGCPVNSKGTTAAGLPSGTQCATFISSWSGSCGTGGACLQGYKDPTTVSLPASSSSSCYQGFLDSGIPGTCDQCANGYSIGKIYGQSIGSCSLNTANITCN